MAVSARDRWGWTNGGACTAPDIHPDTFFPDAGDAKAIAAALAICNGCVVRDNCRETIDLFPTPKKIGVWYGTTDEQRDNERRDARRAKDRERRKSGGRSAK